MWKKKLSHKFAAQMLGLVRWAKENITTDDHIAQVSAIKADSIRKFQARCDRVISSLQVSLDAWDEMDRTKENLALKFPFALEKEDLQVVIFAMREYQYFLDYERRKYDKYIEKDWDSDDRCDLAEDRLYVTRSLDWLETVYEELFGSDFFDW